MPLTPCSNAKAASLRWIRANIACPAAVAIDEDPAARGAADALLEVVDLPIPFNRTFKHQVLL